MKEVCFFGKGKR